MMQFRYFNLCFLLDQIIKYEISKVYSLHQQDKKISNIKYIWHQTSKELSLCHKLKFSNPNPRMMMEQTFDISNFDYLI